MVRLLWRVGALGMIAALAACGSPDGLQFGSDTGGAGATGDNQTGGDGFGGAGASGQGGTAGCEQTGCPAGEFCEPSLGCQPTAACVSNAECERLFGGDPCKTNVQCDQGADACVFEALDGDDDGHAPIECGGGDCDDADASTAPGEVDVCDGQNDDCDNELDEDASCAGLLSCQGGACVCPPQNTCGNACVDKQTDPTHCGNCNVVCPSGSSCTAGDCLCDGGLTACNDVCVDTMSDPSHCGGCNKPCSACSLGQCPCGGDLYILQDLSGSMTQAFGGSPTMWDAARNAIKGFGSGATTGRLGIGYFPKPGVVPPSCTNDLQCNGGICFGGTCIGGGDSCNAADYGPSVAFAPLPGVATSIANSVDGQSANGGTPMVPALQGALTYALNAGTGPSAVVLITDGTPNSCTPATVAGAAAMAGSFANGSPSIKTYVIGLQNPDTLNNDYHAIAQGGGTGAAHIVTTQAGIQSALATIKTTVTGCL
jgi:hypothetical protein